MGQNDFFLNDDDSQSMGNIDYMKMAKKLRRTFPKTLKNPNGFAIERSISSSEGRNFSSGNNGFQAQSLSNNAQSSTDFNSSPTSNTEFTPTSTPRKVDSSMDMFRNMAKNIGKGK